MREAGFEPEIFDLGVNRYNVQATMTLDINALFLIETVFDRELKNVENSNNIFI